MPPATEPSTSVPPTDSRWPPLGRTRQRSPPSTAASAAPSNTPDSKSARRSHDPSPPALRPRFVATPEPHGLSTTELLDAGGFPPRRDRTGALFGFHPPNR